MFIDYLEPPQSSALLKSVADPSCCGDHPVIYSVEGENYQTILKWIEESVRIVGEEVDEDADAGADASPGETVPCDSLPDPQVLPGSYDFQTFQAEINPVLVERCARVGGCHSVPGNGGGLWLLRDEDECSDTWNYLGVRWFIDPSIDDVESSPILSEPLGQQQANDLHGGAVVFQGRDDCGYVKLKLWIEDAFEALPTECR